MSDLAMHVQYIADVLSSGEIEDTRDAETIEMDGPLSAMDWLNDALDIEYVVNSKGEYLGARVLVAFGGPNIWVNTRTHTVEGAWYSDSATARQHALTTPSG